ncbi:aspartyl-phosphate phosphatase Spo0E family protein [Brevibacillus halotolerans]|uniref:aspartyl-phosphate phosphatase Spo0E family protein n=1 Tax=Brevibacillus halotolerans TaxID=1507437 RepID=UPI0015EFD75A|nr:aspartyl-phosphate phosphatase Spo0E family protein [Brevibacillus halotolerans]MBA4535514.1 aspartyl-phosphate phosphatase Spo0E family protein [Brevibacillus halotolerans]
MKTENFKSKDDLQKLIELLRKELEMLYYKEGSFVNPTVLQLSQQLDEYIVLFEKIRR